MDIDFNLLQVIMERKNNYPEADDGAALEACKQLAVALFILSVVLEKDEVASVVNQIYAVSSNLAHTTEGYT